MVVREEKRPPSRMVGLIVGAALLGLGLGGSLFVVDFGGEYVLAQLRRAVWEATGCAVEAGRVSGNPLGGFTLRDLTLSRDGAPLLWAEKMGIFLDLRSLVRGSPAPGLIEVGPLAVDGPRALPLVRSLDAAPSSMPLPSLHLFQLALSLDRHRLLVDRLDLSRRGESFDLRASMTWGPLPLELRGTWDVQGERVLLEESTVKIGTGRGALQGVLGPEIALEGSWEGVRLEELAFAFPGARSDDRGGIAGRIEVRGTYQDPLISGELSLEGGRLRGISLDGGFASGVLTPPLLRVKELRGSIQGAP